MSALREAGSADLIGEIGSRFLNTISNATGRLCRGLTSSTARKTGAVATAVVGGAALTLYVKRDAVYRWLLSNPEALVKAPPRMAKILGAAIVLFGKGREAQGTFRHERFLPKIPVGDLKVVSAGVKQIIRGYRPPEECADFDAKWDAYMAEHGETLMKALREYAKGRSNFLTELVSKHLYTRDKRGLLEASMWYGAGLNQYRFSSGTAQLSLAAHLINACLESHKKLLNNTYPPYTMYGIPLTMETFPKMFSVERIPGEHTSDDTLDTIHQHSSQKHIIIFSKGVPFALTVLNDEGAYLSLEEIYHQLQQIQTLSSTLEEESHPYFSVLSGQSREIWHADRKAILDESSANQRMLNLLGGALFHLSLDDTSPSSLEEQCVMSQGRVLNTWFDACVTWTVGEELAVKGKDEALCYSGSIANHEHADAGVYADLQRLMDNKFSRLTDRATKPMPTPVSKSPSTEFTSTIRSPSSGSDTHLIEEVSLHLPEAVKEKIPTVRAELSTHARNRDLKVLEFTSFGTKALRPIRERGKEFSNVRADPFCEIAIHLADAMTWGPLEVPEELQNLGTYESATTGMFKNGRTETINARSIEMQAFVKAMMDPACSKEERLKKFLAACNKHKDITYDAMCGKGVDRMVMALHAMAKELKIDTSIFEHPSLKAGHRLTTSQVLCASDGGGYGPEIDDGYGIFFKPDRNKFVFHIQSKVSSRYTDSAMFRDNLNLALHQLASLFL